MSYFLGKLSTFWARSWTALLLFICVFCRFAYGFPPLHNHSFPSSAPSHFPKQVDCGLPFAAENISILNNPVKVDKGFLFLNLHHVIFAKRVLQRPKFKRDKNGCTGSRIWLDRFRIQDLSTQAVVRRDVLWKAVKHSCFEIFDKRWGRPIIRKITSGTVQSCLNDDVTNRDSNPRPFLFDYSFDAGLSYGDRFSQRGILGFNRRHLPIHRPELAFHRFALGSNGDDIVLGSGSQLLKAYLVFVHDSALLKEKNSLSEKNGRLKESNQYQIPCEFSELPFYADLILVLVLAAVLFFAAWLVVDGNRLVWRVCGWLLACIAIVAWGGFLLAGLKDCEAKKSEKDSGVFHDERGVRLELYAGSRALPKNGVNSEFVHFVNQDNEVVAEHFAQRLVDHRNVRLAAKPVSEFPFHHGERRFYVAPLVVVLQELRPLELEVMIHLLPRSPAVSSVVRSEGDERCSANLGNGFGIRFAGVSLVSRDFGHLKVLRGCFNHRGKQRRIVRIAVVNLYRRHDVRFDSAHEMALNPIVLLPHLSVLVVKPSDIAAGREARRIDGEVRLYRPKRQTALRNQGLQDRSQFGILKVVENRVIVRRSGNEAVGLGFAQIGHKTPPRNRGIDLERCAENRVSQWQTRPSHLPGLRLLVATAQVRQQTLKSSFLMGLCCVVRRPILRVGCALGGCRDRQRLCHELAAIGILFAFHNVGDREDVLAGHAARLEIGAGAGSNLGHDVYPICSRTSLRRDDPDTSFLANHPSGCKFKAALLSAVHDLRSLNSVDELSKKYITNRYIISQAEFWAQVDFGYNSGEMWKRLWARFLRLWAAFRQVSAVRSLLQWIGVWKGIIAFVCSVGVWLWSHAIHLRGPEQFVLVLVAFAAVLFIANLIQSRREKAKSNTVQKVFDKPESNTPQKSDLQLSAPAAVEIPKPAPASPRFAVRVEHCLVEECSYEPQRELFSGAAISVGNTHRCVSVSFAIDEFDLTIQAVEAEIVFFDESGAAYCAVDMPIWRSVVTLNTSISLGRPAALVLAVVEDGQPFCPQRTKDVGDIYIKGMIAQSRLRNDLGYAAVTLRYEAEGSKASQRFFFALALESIPQITQVDALPSRVTSPQAPEDKEPTLESLLDLVAPGTGNLANTQTFEFPDGYKVEIKSRLYHEFRHRATFLGFYIPVCNGRTSELLSNLAPETRRLANELANGGLQVVATYPGENPQDLRSLTFTGKVYIHHQERLDHRQMADVEDAFRKNGLEVVVRGPEFLTRAWVDWKAKQQARKTS